MHGNPQITLKKPDPMEGWLNMMPQFDVFLSHNSVDKPWVIKLKDDLQCYGISVWLDKDEIRPGDLFAKALEEGLKNSRAVALIVSPEAAASGWVQAEYYRALSLAQNKSSSLQLIPVILRDAELPGFLKDRNWVDFRDESAYSRNVWKLVWGITGDKPANVLDLSAPRLSSDAIVQSAMQTQLQTENATTSGGLPGRSQRALSSLSEDLRRRLDVRVRGVINLEPVPEALPDGQTEQILHRINQELSSLCLIYSDLEPWVDVPLDDFLLNLAGKMAHRLPQISAPQDVNPSTFISGFLPQVFAALCGDQRRLVLVFDHFELLGRTDYSPNTVGDELLPFLHRIRNTVRDIGLVVITRSSSIGVCGTVNDFLRESVSIRVEPGDYSVIPGAVERERIAADISPPEVGTSVHPSGLNAEAIAEIRKSVEDDRLDVALSLLKDSAYTNEVSELIRKLNRVDYQERQRTIPREDVDATRNRIAHEILDLISSS